MKSNEQQVFEFESLVGFEDLIGMTVGAEEFVPCNPTFSAAIIQDPNGHYWDVVVNFEGRVEATTVSREEAKRLLEELTGEDLDQVEGVEPLDQLTDEEKMKIVVISERIQGGTCPGSVITGTVHEREPTNTGICQECSSLSLSARNTEWVTLKILLGIRVLERGLEEFLFETCPHRGRDFLGKPLARGEHLNPETAALYERLKGVLKIDIRFEENSSAT